jgi:ankyrin repeat protein
LIVACGRGKFAEIPILLEAERMNVNVQNHDGKTALIKSIQTKNLEIIQSIVDANADLNLMDRSGNGALTWAVIMKFYEGVRLLGNAGANMSVSA